MTTRILGGRRAGRLLAAGTLAAVLAVFLGVAVVSPSIWNIVPFVNGVRAPSTGSVNPVAQTVGASASGTAACVNGVRGPSASTVAPAAQTVGGSETIPVLFVNGVRGPASITQAYSAEILAASSNSVRLLTNGVWGSTLGTAGYTPTAVSAVNQAVTPQIDRGSSSARVVAPNSFSSSPSAYPLVASSSAQVIAPGSFSSSPGAYPVSASSSAQVLAPGSFLPSPETYPLRASSSAQVMAPSSFTPTPVSHPGPATASAQTLAPSSFAVAPAAGAGPASSLANVPSTTVNVENGEGYTLTMQVAPPASGTTVPPEGTHTLAEGSDVSLSASPSPGWQFDYWGGDPDCADGSVHMDHDMTCIANFRSSSACGDVDCDGDVDVVDALFVLQYVVGMRQGSDQCPPPAGALHLASADVNCDATVNTIDALFILQHVVGLRPELCAC